MLALLDALVARLEASLRARNWEDLSRSEANLRDFVARAMADGSLNAEEVSIRLRRLQLIYQTAAATLEADKSNSSQEMSLARKNFKAASAYLSNS